MRVRDAHSCEFCMSIFGCDVQRRPKVLLNGIDVSTFVDQGLQSALIADVVRC